MTDADYLESAMRAIGDHRRYWEIQRDALVLQAAIACAVEFPEEEIDSLTWDWLQFAHPWSVNPSDVLMHLGEQGNPWQPIDFEAFDQARAYMAQEIEITYDG